MDLHEDKTGAKSLYPTREEVEQMARNNIVLYQALRVAESRKLNWVETLHLAVKCLVEQNDCQHKNMVRMAELSTATFIVAKD